VCDSLIGHENGVVSCISLPRAAPQPHPRSAQVSASTKSARLQNYVGLASFISCAEDCCGMIAKLSCVAAGCFPRRFVSQGHWLHVVATRCAVWSAITFITFPAHTHHLRPPCGAEPVPGAQSKPSLSSFATRVAVIPSLGSPRSSFLLNSRWDLTQVPSGLSSAQPCGTMQSPCSLCTP
jgi:hypothetical protein